MIGSPDAICTGAAPFAVTAAAAQVYPFAPSCSSVTSSLETPLVPPPPRNPPTPPPGAPCGCPVVPVPFCPVVPVPFCPVVPVPFGPVVPVPVCPGGVPIRPKPPPGPPPIRPIPPAAAGPAVGIAPVCAVLIVLAAYAVGPASALTARTVAATSPARRAAVRGSVN